MYVLNGQKILNPGRAWTDAHGIKHPANWATAWPSNLKESMGIVDVQESPKPDSKFYFISSQNLDGTWDAVLKNLDDVDEVDADGNPILDDDGNQLVTLGLKSQYIAATKQTANSLLESSDWQVVAKYERDRDIDANVATYRAAVITKCGEIEAAITACANMDAFRAMFETPVDSDGDATGNPPISDWPVLGD